MFRRKSQDPNVSIVHCCGMAGYPSSKNRAAIMFNCNIQQYLTNRSTYVRSNYNKKCKMLSKVIFLGSRRLSVTSVAK